MRDLTVRPKIPIDQHQCDDDSKALIPKLSLFLISPRKSLEVCFRESLKRRYNWTLYFEWLAT
jgi:hypothetical protein